MYKYNNPYGYISFHGQKNTKTQSLELKATLILFLNPQCSLSAMLPPEGKRRAGMLQSMGLQRIGHDD